MKTISNTTINVFNTAFLHRVVICIAIISFAGCDRAAPDLKLIDLTAGERDYIEKTIGVERALAVTYIHREAGSSLLDSLATAWGDSVVPQLLSQMPGDPKRSIKVDELLLRLLTAEQDSFLINPGANRLHLPLPDLNRPTPVAVPDSSKIETEQSVPE